MNRTTGIENDLWTTGTRGPHRIRKLLPPELAAQLADAHRRTGASYRRVAAALRIDYSYWRKLTMGERCPSVEVAERIIDVLRLDPDTAAWLRAEAVEPKVYPTR